MKENPFHQNNATRDLNSMIRYLKKTNRNEASKKSSGAQNERNAANRIPIDHKMFGNLENKSNEGNRGEVVHIKMTHDDRSPHS